MCGKDPKEPLGLAAGSVRAILALIIIPPIIIGSVVLMFFFFFANQYNSALGILSSLSGISGAVVGYYFGSKAADKATNELIKSHQQAIETKDRQLEMMRNI